ncbi:MAG: thioredoxin domain-containing protein [bacterium]|nr:thioredoxin domain-containing protein [bacterium]
MGNEETSTVRTRGTNRLANETSPYLLQHARNPVDWYPWGEEALQRARDEDKPIFLSIGYSACHWCHVMEHESFENEAIAALLNEHFVNIKVDREERPDLDEIYMTAVQLMTGSGGWPMSVFLTPDLKPFYAGTYFPPEDRFGRPGFMRVVTQLAQVWREEREKVLGSADQTTAAVQRAMTGRPSSGTEAVSRDQVQGAVRALQQTFDPTDGGFGGAPKFPSGPSIALLLRWHVTTGDEEALKMATVTLRKMYEGGVYDHLGGGFHRYSTDAQWLVPHFEKMLYDNAQLAEAYLEAYQLTHDALYRHVAEDIFEYVLRDMQNPEGGFYSSEDADSEGEEGKFYVWTWDELMSVLGEEEGGLFCRHYGVREGGNFDSHESYHQGQNILHLGSASDDAEPGLSAEELEQRLAQSREKLLTVRGGRVRPGLDDKILTSWNGLMINAFAKGYQVLGDERYKDAAVRAGAFMVREMDRDGTLLRTHRNGESRLPAYLDDHAFLCDALVSLYEATFDVRWLEAADSLAGRMVDGFWDSDAGGFFFTTVDHTNLLVRTRPMHDSAEPSGNSIAAQALLRLARLTGKGDYFNKAETILSLNRQGMSASPRGFVKMLSVADFYLNAPKEIAVVGESGTAEVDAFLRTIHGNFVPSKVVALLDPTAPNRAVVEARIPLLTDKKLIDGHPAVYVCKDFACQQPVTSADALAQLLGIAEGDEE